MSDFILDFRPRHQRIGLEAARRMLQFYAHIRVEVHDWDDFRLSLSSCDDRELWSPYTCPRTGDFVAVCGRVAFDRSTWTAAAKLPGGGGLASKAVYQLYEADVIRGLGGLNGNFTVHLYEPARRRLSLIADRTGTYLPFGPADSRHGPVYSSHPDAVAAALDVADQWDEVSIAEFLLTGKVSFPHTFYSGVRALRFGSIFTFDLGGSDSPCVSHVVHSPLDFDVASHESEEQLAEELSEAFRIATERRTYPELGRAAVALSGGLDSQVILSSAHERADLVAFCCSDRENTEHGAARAIAREAHVEFIALRRPFDHYGITRSRR